MGRKNGAGKGGRRGKIEGEVEPDFDFRFGTDRSHWTTQVHRYIENVIIAGIPVEAYIIINNIMIHLHQAPQYLYTVKLPLEAPSFY